MPHTCIDGFIDTFPLRFRTSQDSGVKQNNVLERVQRLVDVEMGFFQMVPEGMSIEAKEISRKGKSGNDLKLQYHIFVKSAPADTRFQEIQWPVTADKPSAALAGRSSVWTEF
jgi:hypothetical protein